MENSLSISQIVSKQSAFFKSQATKDINFRKQALKRLKAEVVKREKDIVNALYEDLKKPEFEAVLTETEVVLAELNLTIKNLSSWAKPKRIFPSMLNFPSTDKIHSEPYGNTLIIGPWNYPYQLALSPLIGAIAAGNTAVLKPSELAPHTSKILKDIISSVFDPEHVAVVEGDATVAQELLAKRWDYIFFTGSVGVGTIVAKAAAEHLTPTTLELGGKNPCIIDATANIKLTAKRIVWGKFLNAGQTCIAPDYILIHKSIKQQFINAMQSEIEVAFTKNPEASKDLARIINERNFNRLVSMLQNETIAIGGKTNAGKLYISPTIIDEPNLDSEVMKGEIFGPILPVLSYEDEDDINAIITKYNKPLSLYVFSTNNTFAKKMITTHSFGGGAINDTIIHFSNHRLPFGGVGHSGLGAYHGKRSFDTFSHKKAVVKKGNWLDIPLRYAPYKGKLKLLKSMLKWMS
jgi:aldehyde dehydrogenase (NAD+)